VYDCVTYLGWQLSSYQWLCACCRIQNFHL
jgi:hypothetical protein